MNVEEVFDKWHKDCGINKKESYLPEEMKAFAIHFASKCIDHTASNWF